MAEITKKALMELLKSATVASPEQKIAYESLMDLCNEAGEYMNLENLSLYNMAILSDGEDETRYILDGGTYESELSGFSDEELDQFVSDVANRVDWTYLEENCTTMVKDMIHDAIHYELADRAATQDAVSKEAGEEAGNE